MKKFIFYVILVQAMVSCTHREFLLDKQSQEAIRDSAGQKECEAKGVRWQWMDKRGCVIREFLGYCQLVNPPSSIANVITYLKNEVNLDDCSEASVALQKLASLYLGNYGIEDIYPLIGFRNLKILLLNNNKIADLFPLKSMHHLRVLRLDENKIKDISALKDLGELVVLRLDHNQIQDVSPLASNKKLAQLNLNHNRIKDVDPLAAIISLRKLGLRGNLIDNISTLSHLPNLEYLEVDENPISRPGFKKTDFNCPTGVDTPKLIKSICQSKEK